MNKDVIYVDTEDDITSIIDKVKNSEAKVVALVPPKRVGVLQSVVNLKLLARAAKTADKQPVVITSNQALTNLAASASLPVAKNLQSKPELPEVTALNIDDEDVINGDELPVGEHAATAPVATGGAVSLSEAVDELEEDEVGQTAAATAAAKAPTKATKKSRVPDFDSFRKKIFLLGGLAVLLIAFLVWAIFFAAHATVTITAKTIPYDINKVLTLSDNAQLDPAQAVAPIAMQSTKKTQSTTFSATGKKNVGAKATGNITMQTCQASFTPPADIPAGTTAASGGNQYVTQQPASFSQSDIGNGCIVYKSNTVAITAAGGGSAYNVDNADFTVSGHDGVSAHGSAAGGTDQTETVVSQSDVAQAKDKLQKDDQDSIKQQLAKQFSGDYVIIDESFTSKAGDPAVSPAVGEKADTAQLAIETTYSVYAIKRSDLKAIFDAYLKTQMSDPGHQKIYASGDQAVSFAEWDKKGSGFSVRATATGQIGPEIDENQLKADIKGKMSGEVQQQISSLSGVQDVKVKLSPFWVSHMPAPDRVTVKFILQDESSH